MSAPPDPEGPWPANTALRFGVGYRLTVTTKTGDTFTGTVRVSCPWYLLLVGDGGQLTVWTGSILSIVNHTQDPPP